MCTNVDLARCAASLRASRTMSGMLAAACDKHSNKSSDSNKGRVKHKHM
jgi:hypothetical protein